MVHGECSPMHRMKKMVIEDNEVNSTRIKQIILKIVEYLVWSAGGASMTYICLSDQKTEDKVVALGIIAVIMVIMFLIFALNVDNKGNIIDDSKSSPRPQRPVVNSSAGQLSNGMKTSARISRNTNTAAGNPLDRKPISVERKEQQTLNNKNVKKLVLINEEGDILLEWSLEGKTAIIIGKSTDNEKVDIDLECSAFAQLISKQHAVLNYTDGGWYVDDIDSKNGTRVKKLYQNSILDVKLVGAVEVEAGDIIYIANTMLQLK